VYSPDSVDFGSGDNGGTGTGAASGSAAGSGTGLTLPDGMSLEDYIKAVVAAETASYAQQSENQDLMKQFADFMAGLPSGVSLSDVLRGVTLSNGMDVEGAVSSLSLPQNFTAQDFLNALVLPENASLRDSFYRLVNDLNSLGSALGSGGSLASVLSSLSSGLDMSSLIGASGLGSLLGAGVGLEALFGSGSDPGSAGLTSLLGSGLISSLLGGMSQVSSSAASFALVPAFSIGDAEKMHVTIAVNELDILTIAKGQEAEVTVEAIQGTTFPGKVTGIEMSGANNGGATRYNVTVELMRDSRMMENMTCTVSVLVSEAENVMSVPSSAVFTEQGKNYVYTSLADDGTLMGRTEVVTGIADETYVEIAEGLEEGRTVYYRSRTANIMDRMEEMENMYGQTQVQS
ncbi:MAG: efflux RND transporter periplasmic adaptor subunit, partial [Lachnospiraceae bacterium]|nr:efflux RND transporter periplasmic adaptor subunit [Lachnospiraceae bacterium]